MRDECVNPSKPCHLHDDTEEWRIEFGRRTIHSGWLLAILLVATLIVMAIYPDPADAGGCKYHPERCTTTTTQETTTTWETTTTTEATTTTSESSTTSTAPTTTSTAPSTTTTDASTTTTPTTTPTTQETTTTTSATTTTTQAPDCDATGECLPFTGSPWDWWPLAAALVLSGLGLLGVSLRYGRD